MRESREDEELIMRYLLGHTSDEEREAVEKRLLADDEFFEQIAAIESELADDYVQGRLSDEDRAAFEQRILSSPEGKDAVAFAKDMVEYVAKKLPSKAVDAKPQRADSAPEKGDGKGNVVQLSAFRKARANPYLRMAASLLLVAGLGLLLYRLFIYQSDVDKGIAALKQAYKAERPTEARIAGFDYAPYSVTRGAGGQAGNEQERERAERILLDAVHDSPSARSYHALGDYYLAEKKFDKAIEQFEKALKFNDKDAQAQADLGAAYLEQGKMLFDKPGGKAVEAFARSVEHLSRALELNDGLLAARFNYALALQQLGLPERAKEEWQKYLEKDPQSKWADEARQKLRELEEQLKQTSLTKEEVLNQFLEAYRSGNDDRAWDLICRNREPLSGRFITEQLLDGYLDKKLNGDEPAAQESFKALKYASNLEKQRADERYPEYLVNYYQKQSIENLKQLKEARDFIKQGHEFYFVNQPEKAIESYKRAQKIFQSLAAPEEVLANYRVGYVYADLYNVQESYAIFAELKTFFEDKSYKWLSMRIYASLAHIFLLQMKYSEALRNSEQSAKIAEQLRDAIGILNARDFLAETYRYVNNYPHSLFCIQQILRRHALSLLNRIQQWTHYSIVASVFNGAGLYGAALESQREAFQVALSDIPNDISVCYANLGAISVKLQRYDEALKNARNAYETALHISDEKLKSDKLAYALLQSGNIKRQIGKFEEAAHDYQEAVAICNQSDLPIYLYQAHKGNTFCCIAEGNDAQAQEELTTSLNLIEQNRSNILEADNRNCFFDSEQSIYDLAIMYECLRAGDFIKAFEYVEQSRARSLLDAILTQTKVISNQNLPDLEYHAVTKPMSLEEIRETMPEKAQILQYAVLERQTIIWRISKSEFSHVIVNISQANLEKQVKDYLQKISLSGDMDKSAVDEAGKALFDVLIKPVEPALDKNNLICIVADKSLNSLPFEALFSPDTQRYLIEDYRISYAPSSSVFVLCSAEGKRKEAKEERLLSIGNPTFDQRSFPALANLPEAKVEAEKVAEFYSHSVCLTGNEAKKQRAEREMIKADVIHLAAHLVLDEFSSLQSKILLASESANGVRNQDAQGVLESREIYNLQLPHTHLVVLSSCQSGIERYYRGEGMQSIVSPFLVAKVPLVIASLWKVDSAATRDLMISFHKHRKLEQVSSVEALREAKLEVIRNQDSRFCYPYYWASFIPIGGYTDF